MDKFEHEKHNRRERVYKYPRISLWDHSSRKSDAAEKKAKRDALELRCLSSYRDFFRNPRNHEYVGESLKSKKFSELSLELKEELKIGSKVFGLIAHGSDRYKAFMTPRELLFWDESNQEMYEKYLDEKESVKEENEIRKNEDMLRALRSSRFKSNS
jgi:hypothetical protein